RNNRVRRTYDCYTPPQPLFFVARPATPPPPLSVTFSGAAGPHVRSQEELDASTADAYYWNADIEVTFIKVFDRAADVKVTALYP
ncbi:MAG: hypothetical protein ACHRXM_33695, partial [Isosphaerales bacterium]